MQNGCLERLGYKQRITAFLGRWAVIFLHFYRVRILSYMQLRTLYLRSLQYNISFLSLSYAVSPPLVDSPKGFYVNRAFTPWWKTNRPTVLR